MHISYCYIHHSQSPFSTSHYQLTNTFELRFDDKEPISSAGTFPGAQEQF